MHIAGQDLLCDERKKEKKNKEAVRENKILQSTDFNAVIILSSSCSRVFVCVAYV